MSKKLTYTDKKRHYGTLPRGDGLVHVNGITYIEADLKLNHLRILMRSFPSSSGRYVYVSRAGMNVRECPKSYCHRKMNRDYGC